MQVLVNGWHWIRMLSVRSASVLNEAEHDTPVLRIRE